MCAIYFLGHQIEDFSHRHTQLKDFPFSQKKRLKGSPYPKAINWRPLTCHFDSTIYIWIINLAQLTKCAHLFVNDIKDATNFVT